jgi:isopenicillin N synthase-like dioxygenase
MSRSRFEYLADQSIGRLNLLRYACSQSAAEKRQAAEHVDWDANQT